jgi:(p)ppGpp synthase/HD superfamily hydrolase
MNPMSNHSEEVFSPLVEHAIELAAQWHDGTYRKSSWRDAAFEVPPDDIVQVPVMAHLTAVATTVQRAGWDDATVAAAYLHDVIEDMNQHGKHFRYEQLRKTLGAEVAAIVEGVSEQKYDDDGNVRPWRARKEDYIDQLCAGPPQAMAISLADKLHNLWSMNQALANGENVFAHGPNRTALNAGPEQQRWFHRRVLEAADAHDDPRLVPLRERLLAEIETFERWMEDQAVASDARRKQNKSS